MKKRPTSAKKHKALRRRRTWDWDKARENMEEREAKFDKAVDDYLACLAKEDQSVDNRGEVKEVVSG